MVFLTLIVLIEYFACILQVKSTEDCNEKLHNIAIQLFSF